ncbi:Protein of unknown function (DUF559) [Actinobacteria bacterium IMCC26256]|nr:Protein of unknown function (DUF559) [Actinobacteria bacterium IMCC26256]
MATTMTWDEWIRPRQKDLKDDSHGHELDFVEKVLRKVIGLSPESVTHQVAFKDVQGGNRRIDFVIADATMARQIAIEVDGLNKTGEPTTHRDNDNRNSRQNALTAAGYTLVRYTNNQVNNKANDLIAEIENAIAKERAELLRLERLSSDTAHGVASKVAVDTAVVHAATRVAGAEAARVGEAVATEATKRYLEEKGHLATPAASRPATVAPKSSSNGGVIAAVIAVAVVVILIIAISSGGGGGGSSGGGGGSNNNDSQPNSSEVTDPPISSTPSINPDGVAPASYQSCPSDYPLKGNQTGIYHSPGQQYYDQTSPQQCFATPEDAERAGYRASKV